MPETMRLTGITKIKIIKNKNGENIPHLEINEVVLVHSKFKIQNSIIPSKFSGQLLDISLGNFIFLKTFDSEFSYIEAIKVLNRWR